MAAECILDYRRKAEECRQLANLSLSADDKAQWLMLATGWLELAETKGMPDHARSQMRQR